VKRTCLHKNTNTHEQNSCEFHPAKIPVKEQWFYPKGTQQVRSLVQMKIAIAALILELLPLNLFAQTGTTCNKLFFLDLQPQVL